MKLAIFSVIFAQILISGIEMKKTDSLYREVMANDLHDAFKNLPIGKGKIGLPNFSGKGQYGKDTVTFETSVVVVSGLDSVKMGQCDTVTTATANITTCGYTVPKAGIRFVLNATRHGCYNVPYGKTDCSSFTTPFLQFSGRPTKTFNGKIVLTSALHKLVCSKVTGFTVSPIQFDMEKKQYSRDKVINKILKNYGTSSKFAKPLENPLPGFMQNILNNDII